MTDQNIFSFRSTDPIADVTGQSAADSGATGGAGGQRSRRKAFTTVQVLIVFIFASIFYI
jgi:hypothetical protein